MSAEAGSRGKTASPTVGPDAGPVTLAEVFTLGYQSRDLEQVLQTVQSHGIEQVLDVREHAASKKPGFSAAELKEALAGIGVVYVHLPELGCRRGSRHALWRGEPAEAFLEEYRQRLAERPQALADLVRRIRSARSLLLCLERDPARCHRAVLEERVRAEGIRTQDL